MIHLYCGDGKGKTTAATGLAIRACGAGKTVIFVQFLKGRETGELTLFARIPEITVMRANASEKFTFQMSDEEKLDEKKKYLTLLENAFIKATDTEADVLVLDEVVTAAERGMISEERLRELMDGFDSEKELILTGSVPEAWMIEAADYVTDMEKIKHPFDKGIKARKGIEY